jgi:hypothetical protein
MKKISNTLAGFKQLLESAKINGIHVRSTILNPEGQAALVRPFSPVGRVQSNAFTILREGREFWVEFNKSSSWEFDLPNGKATKLHPNGMKTMIIEISTPEFFNL